jgi:Uma2 family endonuclease
VQNFTQIPQAALLSETIRPVLDRLHPDGHYLLGGDNAFYWRHDVAPERGRIVPDWFYVPGVPPLLDGIPRRSYVLWKELVPPRVVLEFVSRNGREETDRTPLKGKYWIYEKVLHVPYYGIFDPFKETVTLLRFLGGRYEPMAADDDGLVLIEPLGVKAGVWHGTYAGMETCWLRFFALDGTMLPSLEDTAEYERQQAMEANKRADGADARAKVERQRAKAERQRAEAERQRADGADARAEAERQRADGADARAEAERERAERLAEKLRALGISFE